MKHSRMRDFTIRLLFIATAAILSAVLLYFIWHNIPDAFVHYTLAALLAGLFMVLAGWAVYLRSRVSGFADELCDINSMITAIVSRKREFAMIQSFETTKKQLRNMLFFEGLYYAVLTLLLSYITSALAVGIGVRAMVADGYTTFRFTLLPLLYCTPLLLLLAVLIPYLCFRNLEKNSIVERLRME